MSDNTGTARSGTDGEIELPWMRFGDGSGEPLLLVNGLGSPSVSYEDGFVAEFTARGFDVVRYDNRDAGRATSTEGGYLLADMADDAVAVLDAVGWETAHVFGMSMGGMIVQQLGIAHADRLRSHPVPEHDRKVTGHVDDGGRVEAATAAIENDI